MKTEIKPCPFCGSTDIKVELKHDCYSSWGRAECGKCYSYKECGTDKTPDMGCPCPVENWEELIINAWNSSVFRNERKEIIR